MNPNEAGTPRAPHAGDSGWHRLVDLSNDACFVVAGQRIVYANAAGIRLLGATDPRQVIGHEAAEFVREEHRGEARAAMDALTISGEAIRPDWVLQRLDGGRVEAEVASAAFDLDGQPAIGAIVRDVVERRRVESELRLSGERASLAAAERTARAAAEEAVRRLESIQQVTDAALAHLGLEAMLRELLARIRRVLDADAATILLATEDGKSLTVRASDGFPAGAQASIPFVKGMAAEIATSRAPVAVDDMSTTDGVRSVLAEPLHSVLGVPLLVEGRVIGVLKVGTARRHQFSADETAILQVVADRIAPAIDRARLHDELVIGRRRLEAVSRRLLEVQETERRHVARELHDEVGQLLTSLKLRLESGDPARHGGETREIVNDLMARVRDLSMKLMPPMLDDLGLLPALMWHVERFTAQTRVRVIFRHAGIDRRFRRDIELAAYRIAQEGLTNVARHTSVARAKLEVWASSDSLGVEVSDDGQGFDVEAATSGASLGLPGMRERVRLVGGELTIDSSPGEGTRLSAVLPLAAKTAKA